ncbi:hypothetical protein SEPCBS119000_003890 [Sporothrix epigloea]|uniref:Uncharacterized protein n=1 Tax=Sporothrix epigloea TaxID=1892477 RepID=A0ABP0DP48_9PEZI
MAARPRTVKLQIEPAPAKGFFRLPRELRQRVYEFSLIEPPKWEKLHKPDCFLTAQDLHSCERPPFINQTIIDTPLPGCQCARRQCLNVLLVNRQVHREAAPVLWSRNVFCFTRVADFALETGKKLRPEHRLMLRHLVVLLYGCDSLPGQSLRRFPKVMIDKLWETILLCSGLRTLEMSHNVFADRFEYVCRVRKQLPHLQSLRIATLMAYRIWPRQDQSAPGGRITWVRNNGIATNRPPQSSVGHHHDNTEPPPPPPPEFVPFAEVVPPPPPPPPAEHYLVLSPYLPGFCTRSHRDLSRTLWFKASDSIDIDCATESLEAYVEMYRNFRTNFLVHLRHEISKLPEVWARDYQMGSASLRTPWTRPPQPLPRRVIDQLSASDPDSDGGGGTGDPDNRIARHNPIAIRQVCGRLPAHIRDGPYTDPDIVLRDGRHVALQIMGLPISKQMRTWRYQQRMRIAHDAHAEGKLTAREEVEAKAAQERRHIRRLERHRDDVDSQSQLDNRQRRNLNRECEQQLEARAARAAQRAQAEARQEALEAVRQAARRRVQANDGPGLAAIQGGAVDEGSEADSEDHAPRHRITKPKSAARGKKPLVSPRNKRRGLVAAGDPGPPTRQQGRMELYYDIRDGMFADDGDVVFD